jgi:hypothetical protein
MYAIVSTLGPMARAGCVSQLQGSACPKRIVPCMCGRMACVCQACVHDVHMAWVACQAVIPVVFMSAGGHALFFWHRKRSGTIWATSAGRTCSLSSLYVRSDHGAPGAHRTHRDASDPRNTIRHKDHSDEGPQESPWSTGGRSRQTRFIIFPKDLGMRQLVRGLVRAWDVVHLLLKRLFETGQGGSCLHIGPHGIWPAYGRHVSKQERGAERSDCCPCACAVCGLM